jgi:membrane-associated phospholipid phosphatase
VAQSTLPGRFGTCTRRTHLLRRLEQSFLFVFTATIFFAFPSLCVGQQDPGNLDVSLFRRINDGRSRILTDVVNVNSDLVLPIAIAAPVGFMSYGILSKNEYETDTGLLVGMSEIVSFGLGHGLKYVVKRDRPYAALTNVHYSGPEIGDPYSFPSGHATDAFALATSLSLRYPKPAVYIPLHLWALFVAYGRVYQGVHYPSDVLVGGMIGSGTAVIVHLLEDEIIGLKTRLLGKGGGDGSSRGGISLRFVPLSGGGVVQLTYNLSLGSP